MQIVNLPLLADANFTARKYFSDDVNNSTRCYGYYFDCKREESDYSFLVQIFSNSYERIDASPAADAPISKQATGITANRINEQRNPLLTIFKSPIFVPGGITILIGGGRADHLDPLSLNVFVER